MAYVARIIAPGATASEGTTLAQYELAGSVNVGDYIDREELKNDMPPGAMLRVIAVRHLLRHFEVSQTQAGGGVTVNTDFVHHVDVFTEYVTVQDFFKQVARHTQG